MEYRADQVPMNRHTSPYQCLKEDGQSVPSTIINLAPNVRPIRDHLLWSLFSFFYMNFCCLGFVALVFSVMSRDRKVVGDVEGARHYASTARALNIATTVLSILVFLIFIVMLSAGVFQALQIIKQEHHQQQYHDVFGGGN
ncbi:dispanin subfamily A member 2b-like [Heterodontus francisci]|uniref:dispanin subfamily A member 2b-like n=1 Tax=Heterodontus francisci TaxID=7792 RepID=UPI00355BA3F8